jgi:Stage II sporulation protein
LPAPEKADEATARITFSKPGYTTVVRSNVDLNAGTVQKYRLRFRPGGGTSEIDEKQLCGIGTGAVAVRGYGAWHAEHPLTASYDTCDYEACEMYDPASTNSRTDAAVDATKGKVLVDQAGAIARSDYAAENNNAGCGDAKTGTNQPIAPCIPDVSCKGTAKNGHGSGMCQLGSQRWATGKDHDDNPVDGGPETYDWILKHYYLSLTVGTGATEFLSTIQ